MFSNCDHLLTRGHSLKGGSFISRLGWLNILVDEVSIVILLFLGFNELFSSDFDHLDSGVKSYS